MISNASPLINFAKLNKLDLLAACVGVMAISEKVFEEVVRKGSASSEAELIDEQIKKGNIVIKKLGATYLQKAEQIRTVFKVSGLGESTTIALALQENESEVLIDDLRARETAKLNGLKPLGSLRILLIAFDKGIINEEEVKKLFGRMLENKLWISGEVVIKFLELFEKVKKRKRKL